ncbi:MAG: sigma-54-dependent Fis family transcriptional regulator [Deltaproteobacteria bacterium]|nr:sigma-54-dependent Fis family transcriptional regulator [Deltaproteobacteria bacterium]
MPNNIEVSILAYESNAPSVAGSILIVDDQKNMRTTTGLILRQAGYRVAEAEDGHVALSRLASETYDVLLTDLRMEGFDGLELLRSAIEMTPNTQVIVMTAYGTIESAVEAIRRGAFDYLAKPFKEDELLLRVEKALAQRQLLREMSVLTSEFRERYGLENLIGRSQSLRELLTLVVRVAPTDATVLITGESGTGKELVARAIHTSSGRAQKSFVPVNCAAITETLLESELFGHAKGAFTGAIRARRGLFEEADGGTLFIDEIGETTPGFQAKLLRVLQDGEIRRVGESQAVRVDVRVIAATNQDLRKAVFEKRFREDLFYRLNVVPLRVPTLRERSEDIPLLAAHFLANFNKRSNDQKKFTPTAIAKMLEYSWPGNVRELENMVEQAAALSATSAIAPKDIRFETTRPTINPSHTLADVVEIAERRAIAAAIVRHDGNLERVARDLGISATTLWRKLKRYNLQATNI